MTVAPALAPDAAMALGIAATALPFAQTREDAAERWLRILRLQGRAGAVLQSLGVSEQALGTAGHHPGPRGAGGSAAPQEQAEHGDDEVAQVTDLALRHARERGESGITTTDVLLAALDVYGEDFERVLRAHGTDGAEVRELLGEPGASA